MFHSRSAPFLLLPFFWTLRNRLRSLDRSAWARLLQAGVLTLGIWGAIIWLSSRMFRAFLRYPSMTDALMLKTLGATLAAALGLAVIAGAAAGVGIFFRSRDVRPLLASPVDWLQHYLAQLAQVAVQGSLPAVLILSPILIAAGLALDVSWAYLVSGMVGGLLLMLMAAAWASLLTLAFTALSGVRGAGKVGFLLALVLLWWLLPSLRTLLPVQLILESEEVSTVSMVEMLQTPPRVWLPSDWLARAMVRGRETLDGWALAGLLGAALGSITFSSIAFGGSYRWVLARSQSSSGEQKVKVRRARAQAGWGVLSRLFSPATEQIVRKELVRLHREGREWTHWLLSLAGGCVYLAALAGIPKGDAGATSYFLLRLLSLVNIGVAGLLLASVSTHTLLPGFYREACAEWVLRSAPPSWRSLVRIKFAVGLLTLLPLSVAIALGGHWALGASLSVLVITLPATLASAFLVVALGVAFAARFPQHEARNATAVASSPVAILFILASLVAVLIPLSASAPLLMGAPEIGRRAGLLLPEWLLLSRPLAWVLWSGGIGFCLLFGAASLTRASRFLERRGARGAPPYPKARLPLHTEADAPVP